MPSKVDVSIGSIDALDRTLAGVIEISGPDALAFLQAQTMNDVRALEDGQWQWNGWLTPKGRVQALFALLRRDPARAWLLLPDGAPETLCEALRRFVFRSKVTLRVRDDLTHRQFAAPPGKCGRSRSHVAADGDRVWLDLGGSRPRSLVLAPVQAPGSADAEPVGAPLDVAAATLEDLAHGLPRGPAATAAQYTPQMLGLERLQAYSVKKGCYPGQEIVARTHFLGQVKRSLRRVRAPRVTQPGERLAGEHGEEGEIACSAAKDRHWESLAILPADLAPGCSLRLVNDAAPVHVVAFDSGLER